MKWLSQVRQLTIRSRFQRITWQVWRRLSHRPQSFTVATWSALEYKTSSQASSRLTLKSRTMVYQTRVARLFTPDSRPVRTCRRMAAFLSCNSFWQVRCQNKKVGQNSRTWFRVKTIRYHSLSRRMLRSWARPLATLTFQRTQARSEVIKTRNLWSKTLTILSETKRTWVLPNRR